MKIPVIDASWNDYQDFVTKLNEKAGKTGGEFRLPTEAEWEYACRAGSTTKWYFGDAEPELGEYAWYQPNCGGTLHPVGQKRPNAWGLFDMMGNAWEWCADWYDAEYYARSSTDDPAGAEGGSQRVARGGCYNLDAGGCKASFRWSNAPAGRGLGFRLARILSLPSVATSEQTAAGSRQLLPFPVSNTNAAETQSSLKEIAVDVGNGVTMEMILIPAGQFLMGSPDSEVEAPAYEKPQHRVRITSPFYLGKYEVTEQQWEAVMPINVSRQKGPNNPVEMVSWNDCQDFLERLNQKTGKTGGEFRLPTEAEWEYACRAGSTTKWHFGDAESELGEYAWYSGLTTHPVGQKRPNAWGLHDMHGNVWEWCADWQDVRYYGRSPSEDPTGAAGGSMRVARGGGWTGGAEGRCRTAYRYGGVPSVRCPFMGFRLARKGPVP